MLPFLDLQALGRAILQAGAEGPPVPALLGRYRADLPKEPCRAVVLIDEIDKAPRDFPNDLLMEIEAMRFFIPELNGTVAASEKYRPIVVITSNNEKGLPDAFLRRCVYYNIPPPSHGRLPDRGRSPNRTAGIVAACEGYGGIWPRCSAYACASSRAPPN